MARTYTAKDLIQLPRLSGREALVLFIELETVLAAAQKDAKAAKKAGKPDLLPPALLRSMARLKALALLLQAVLSPQAAADSQAKRKADRVVDNAWAAFFSWLVAFCLLPPEKNPHQAAAVALRELIFAEGLSFTQLPYKIEWQESKSRLEAIARDGHATMIEALGGAVFLEHLHEAQASYGDALHITKPKDAPPDEEVRSKLLATLDAIRDYANRAATVADPEEPGSAELAESLLRPLLTWESRPVSADAEDPAIDAPPPAPGAPGAAAAPAENPR